MRRFNTTIFLALATVLLVSSSSAQQAATTSVPNLIRYAGSLKDANGAPIAATTGVTFAIYNQQDGGAAVWMETQNIAPDASGQYSVLLGSTSATGLPSDLFSQEEQRWLGVQVQGQAEQARVMLVSVPYAFKAHEAETLAGKSISEFVLAKDLNSPNSSAGIASVSGSGSTQVVSGKDDSKSPSTLQALAGPTNFSGSTPDQIVRVTQMATNPGNNAIFATNLNMNTSNAIYAQIPGAGRAIYGVATSTSSSLINYGVEGDNAAPIGVGVVGWATSLTGNNYGVKGQTGSPNGTGVRGLATAATGVTYGVSGLVSSPNGNAIWGQAAATSGGTGVWGQSLATTGAATGVLGTAASNAGTGVVATESATTGTTYALNAKVQSLSGTAAWLQNTAAGRLILATTGPSTSPVTQFSLDGSGHLNTTSGTYQIGGNNVVSLGSPINTSNLFLGAGAGSNATGNGNTFTGFEAGFRNTGDSNTMSGYTAGTSNTTGSQNSFYGYFAGGNNTSGMQNVFLGQGAGSSNINGSSNTYVGTAAGDAIQGGSNNIFIGFEAGDGNGGGSSDIYLGSLGTLEDHTVRIGTMGTGNLQQNRVFFDPILLNPTTLAPVTAVTIAPNGQLGVQSITPGIGGFGNVVGPGNCLPNFLTKWVGINNVDCSHVWENSTSDHFVGIGTTNPSKALDVSGEINAQKWYDIGLPETSVLSIGPTVTFGDGNLFVGAQAGNNIDMPGGNDTFVGYQAGYTATGIYNVFAGYQAGYGSTPSTPNTGSLNTYIGWLAGVANTTGFENVFTGNQAGSSNTSGTENTFTGFEAGYFTQTGSGNTFLGFEAGLSNTTGSNDIYIGHPGPSAGNESGTVRIGQDAMLGGTITDTYMAGIYNNTGGTVGPSQTVCVDTNGKLFGLPFGFDRCEFFSSQKQHTVVASQQDVIKAQQEQIQAQGQQIAELQQRLSRLESLITKK